MCLKIGHFFLNGRVEIGVGRRGRKGSGRGGTFRRFGTFSRRSFGLDETLLLLELGVVWFDGQALFDGGEGRVELTLFGLGIGETVVPLDEGGVGFDAFFGVSDG